MQLNDQKEQFSHAYVHAVAACAGYQFELPSKDRNSVDGWLLSDAEIIEFQAKATSQNIERDEIVRFRLPVKNYDDLRETDPMALRVLIVVQVPDDDPQTWIDQSDEQLCLAGRGVWLTLRGEPPASNVDNITVQIPTSNRFDREGLTDLMRSVQRLVRDD